MCFLTKTHNYSYVVLMRLKVKNIQGNIRLTDYCAKNFPILGSRSAAKKAINAGRIFLNHRRSFEADMVNNGDIIVLKKPKEKQRKIGKIAVPIEIIFEDDYLIIANKPAGIAVNGNRKKTLENIVATVVKRSNQKDALPKPVAAHRIDVPTKGLVILAKTKSTLININKAFQNNQIHKTYVAVVHGDLRGEGRIETPINGKSAITLYKNLSTVPSKIFGYLSLLQLKLITGRTHQLRIHLKETGHLIVGDKQYVDQQRTILGKGLFLCSCELSLKHPITQRLLEIKINPPNRFNRLLDRERTRFNKE